MSRKVVPGCDHPYEKLTIMAPPNVRGSAPSVRVSCQSCGKRIAGNDGTVRFVLGMRDDLKAMRRAIANMGGTVLDPSLIPGGSGPRGKRRANLKESCPHYLGWLDIAGGGSGQRGRASSSTVRCRNCQTTWGDHSALLMTMKRELETMWLEIRRLGGTRPQ